jgi:hypothetical protein
MQIMELVTSKPGLDSQLAESIKTGISKLKSDKQPAGQKDDLSLSESSKRQKL